MLVLFFISFFMLFTFGLLNMIVGMVVEKTLEQSQNDIARSAKEKESSIRETMQSLKEIFALSDQDGNGELTRIEFETALKDPEVIKQLRQVGFPDGSLHELFD